MGDIVKPQNGLSARDPRLKGRPRPRTGAAVWPPARALQGASTVSVRSPAGKPWFVLP